MSQSHKVVLRVGKFQHWLNLDHAYVHVHPSQLNPIILIPSPSYPPISELQSKRLFSFRPLSAQRKCREAQGAPRRQHRSKSLTMLFTSSLLVILLMFEPSTFRFHFLLFLKVFRSIWYLLCIRWFSFFDSEVFLFLVNSFLGFCFLAWSMEMFTMLFFFSEIFFFPEKEIY